MRNWIEKLAKVSEEEGRLIYTNVGIGCYKWMICRNYGSDDTYSLYLEDEGNYRAINTTIYRDEYDLLTKVYNHVKEKTEDYFIDQINTLP